LMARLMSLGNAMFAQSAAHGAWPTVFAATAPGLRGGEFIGPRGLRLWGRPNVQRSSARSHDPALAARLWACSEELTGVRYLSSPAEAGGTRASP
jgi:hypothetical protein